jgi:hypothetical protein
MRECFFGEFSPRPSPHVVAEREKKLTGSQFGLVRAHLAATVFLQTLYRPAVMVLFINGHRKSGVRFLPAFFLLSPAG